MEHRSSSSRDGDDARAFAVSVVVLVDGDHDALLMLASVLHRRGVAATEARLTPPAHGRQVFDATFDATPRMAGTVLKTFQNQLKVLDAVLVEVHDTRRVPEPALSHAD